MTIKSKISSALAFLFAVVLAIGGLSAYYLNRLAADSQAILKDNYVSLEYVSAMQQILAGGGGSGPAAADALADFDANLKQQEANVTEVGEGEATRSLRRAFDRYRRGADGSSHDGLSPGDSLIVGRLQQSLFAIDALNRQAIVRKNDVAKQTARDALLWLSVVGTFSVLVLFSFIISFPAYIANPLGDLTRGIRQIASRNFEERLPFRSSDEFGELARSFNRMAEKLDEYEHSNLAQVLFEKRRIDTLIQIMSEGILGLDEKRRILFANPVACRLLGMDQAGLVGQYAPDVATQNDLMRTLIADIMAPQPLPQNGTNLLKIYDGGKENYFNKRTHSVEVTRTGEEQPQQAGYVIVLENITSYKELDVAKTNFIATVSHELKTPLSSIKMSLKLLEDSRIGTLNDEQKQLTQNVRDDADRLLNLTGELLTMTQVESGQIQLNIRPVAPADIVQYATDALRVQAEQKHIRFVIHAPDALPAVNADPDKASWVLVNFLSNAIRHSPDENVIEVSTTRQGDYVEFRVRDHGSGIRPEHQPLVFDRYFKAPGLNGQATGTGLGLAISSEFIQSMNGVIGLDTSVTDGAAFYFRLPC
jgi:two-component system, NtrC family, sensor histidine kinase KinB